ncbi:PREDICTED: uncharacterized protein LOC104704468 [Camelina sativa]|uniref:Uncharacterized protein LOC104704468 n=1 Tax=Camelina sativa TaxID=90675 RepID=A0ABM1Q744_CAMSA|nr:PREDICTED: uncharacterized protein LOC104704468 [Camelina sativa]
MHRIAFFDFQLLIVADRDYHSHVICPIATMDFQGLCPSIPNQTSLTPFLIWIIYQFVEISMIVLIYPPYIYCGPYLMMLIRWNHDVFLYRKFVSGVFTHCRCNFRVSTGECPLTQWNGGSTWVFDPGIDGGINLLDEIKIGDRIRFLWMLTMSDDGDAFSLPWLEYFISSSDYMGCGVYGSKFMVATFIEDDDDTRVMGRKKAANDCDRDVSSFPWSKFFTSMQK